jgi:hypothetical protein
VHLELERVALGMHSLVQRRDEGLVKLSQALAEAESEYEALDEASFCQSSAHDLPHLGVHWMDDHIQNELGTDLQLGSADSPADAAAAAHMLPHGSQEGAAGHMRRTWGAAVRRLAIRCVQEQKPVSAQTQA